MHTHEWWQKGIIYQVYPRSFMDASGDGVGDLRGVISKLDYLQWLGVDALWLSPIYPSPMADFGYDISDYCDVHPMFGRLGDLDELVAETHRRGMRVVLDFVPNHTSDQHPWFIESRRSRQSAKRDWYLWRDPAPGGGPPNNWLSNFGGSAWELDPTTGQYYYHAFLKEQPDVNWRNPELRAAMHEVLRFWLRRGIDGFRVDVIWHIVKDDEFRDNPRNPDYTPGQNPHHEQLATYNVDRPEVHDIIAEMRDVVDEFPNRMMVGEIYLPIQKLVTYYGEGGEGVHMPFNFQLITTLWNAEAISHAVREYEAALPSYGWPNWVVGNHDKPRIASRVGGAQARVAAMLLLTLRGTPTIYYGDEIGMHDVPIPPDRVQDPFEKNVPGMGLGRDPQRTPMQWDESKNAGFAPEGVKTWLPISCDHAQCNVSVLQRDPKSILNLYRRLVEQHRTEPAICIGAYSQAYQEGDVFAYVRYTVEGGSPYLVVLNFGSAEVEIPMARVALPAIVVPQKPHVVLSTHLDRQGPLADSTIPLRSDEGLVIRLA